LQPRKYRRVQISHLLSPSILQLPITNFPVKGDESGEQEARCKEQDANISDAAWCLPQYGVALEIPTALSYPISEDRFANGDRVVREWGYRTGGGVRQCRNGNPGAPGQAAEWVSHSRMGCLAYARFGEARNVRRIAIGTRVAACVAAVDRHPRWDIQET
jgi:hypothetical protein